jgi:hypothetical protein
MLKIAVIIGSTRPGRNGEAVAKWIYEIAQKRGDAEFELVDIKDFNLPLSTASAAVNGAYSKPHQSVGRQIGSFDSYVFVARVQSRHLRRAQNAIDFLFAEWNNKAAGCELRWCWRGARGRAGPPGVGGTNLDRAQSSLALMFTDFENYSVFKPDARHEVCQCNVRSVIAGRRSRRSEDLRLKTK